MHAEEQWTCATQQPVDTKHPKQPGVNIQCWFTLRLHSNFLSAMLILDLQHV